MHLYVNFCNHFAYRYFSVEKREIKDEELVIWYIAVLLLICLGG